MALRFTSVLDKSHRKELETLFFFHPQQKRFHDSIMDTVKRNGMPGIVSKNGGLRIELAGQGDIQTLYAMLEKALTRELVGAIVYARNADNELAIRHIVVKDDYTTGGTKAEFEVAFQLITELRRAAQRIGGVRGVRLPYNQRRTLLTTLPPLPTIGSQALAA
jgi:hypothetical protein